MTGPDLATKFCTPPVSREKKRKQDHSDEIAQVNENYIFISRRHEKAKCRQLTWVVSDNR